MPALFDIRAQASLTEHLKYSPVGAGSGNADAVLAVVADIRTKPKVARRFWSYVQEPSEPGNCWLWLGALTGIGYGQVWVKAYNRNVGAHRVSFVLAGGHLISGQVVCHHCDNACCVNPEHLFVGTQKDNVRDCYAKGRGAIGPAAWPRTHCKRGHEFTPENTLVRPPHRGRKYPQRRCRACAELKRSGSVI